jgi:hypothetical protein
MKLVSWQQFIAMRASEEFCVHDSKIVFTVFCIPLIAIIIFVANKSHHFPPQGTIN